LAEEDLVELLQQADNFIEEARKELEENGFTLPTE